MKKLVSWIALLCFSLNSFAATGNGMILESLLSEYHYTMTVEWDQKDKSFFEEQNSFFYEKLNKLLAEGVVSQETILSFAESKLTKEQLANLQMKLSMSQPKTSNELSNLLFEIAKTSTAQGASWNGSVMYFYGAFVLMFGLFAILVLTLKETVCVERSDEGTYQCRNDGGYNDGMGLQCDTYYKCTKWQEIKY